MVETETSMNAFAGFRTGTILSKSLGLLRKNVVLFTSLAAVAAAPEFLISAMSEDAGLAAESNIGDALWALWPGAVVTAIMSTLSTAIIVYLVLHQLIGQPVRVGEAIAATIARLPYLIGVSLVALLALIGMPLLVFALSAVLPVLTLALSMDGVAGLVAISLAPGLVLLTLWYVAVPVCVMERRGVFQSFRRSSALTKGARSKLFALVILEIALSYISGTLAPDAVSSFVGSGGQTAVQFVLVSLQYAFAGVLVGVVYYALCMEKQGFGSGQVAAVFD